MSGTTHKSSGKWARSGPIGAASAVLLVVVALWEVLRVLGAQAPDEAAWAKAAAFVRQNHEPGELIVFAPSWTDPLGRAALGDRIPMEMAARMDAARYGTIWELSLGGARAAETHGLAPVLETSIAGITVRRFERAPAMVSYDFVAAAGEARMRGAATASLEEVGFEPHRCIKAVPAAGGEVTVTYPQARLGTELVGYVGLADVFTRRDVRQPGHLQVLVRGKEVAQVSPGVDDGWVRFAVKTEPGVAEVRFVASAAVPQRLICFAAEARQ